MKMATINWIILFKKAFAATEMLQGIMGREDDHEKWVDKDMWGGGKVRLSLCITK
jgi:hypothetical protein